LSGADSTTVIWVTGWLSVWMRDMGGLAGVCRAVVAAAAPHATNIPRRSRFRLRRGHGRCKSNPAPEGAFALQLVGRPGGALKQQRPVPPHDIPERMAMERRKPTRRWSQRVTTRSNALDLDRGVFTWKDPRRIARSLKRSAEHSRRRKSDAFRSALSMLTFYINRAGRGLPASRKRVLQQAKDELRRQFGRTA
jgi:hypothetical protein